MSKLSIIIPSRDERFLTPTIDDIFHNARGEIEVVAVLDSDKWPPDWKEVTARRPNLHTLHNGSSLGMRASINRGVASAVSRGAQYVMKLDGHCSLAEGFDEILKAECDMDWVVVPRRLRLDPEAWTIAEPDKPPYDYHYLSFPDDPNDWGGAGLNGKPWFERGVGRADIPVDDEMSSQGSAWFMRADYFCRLELMDEANYGTFWNEFQEIGLKCWLSGGQVKVNKKTWYAHLHKGKKYGRGYRLQESALTQGRNHTMKWIWNEAWAKQTLSFKWLIEHFSPVPGWPESWEEKMYATRKPRNISVVGNLSGDSGRTDTGDSRTDRLVTYATRQPRATGTAATVVDNGDDVDTADSGDRHTGEKVNGMGVKADDYAESLKPLDGEPLNITHARYGVLGSVPPFADHSIDVKERVQSLVRDNGLDIIVNNSTLTPGQNPFRGKKKVLLLSYAWGGREGGTVERMEKDWLIIGQAQVPRTSKPEAAWAEVEAVMAETESLKGRRIINGVNTLTEIPGNTKYNLRHLTSSSGNRVIDAVINLNLSRTATALNDYLIRKFSLSDRRLRGPMPIELRDFHRNDLAQLFAELGFTCGAEIGVAEGHYSEVLCKSIPSLQELLLVDPWRRYDGNPWAHSQEHQDFSLNETKRKTAGYNVRIMQDYSMDAVREIPDNSLDFCYIDGHHGFDWVMQDLIEWSKRVRSGGIVSGDDYYHFKKSWAGVVEAVNAYTDAHRISPWFLIDAPRSVDFFWVKP